MRVSAVLVLGVVSYLGPKLGDNDCKNKMKIPVISYAVTFGWFVPVTTMLADCLMLWRPPGRELISFTLGNSLMVCGGHCTLLVSLDLITAHITNQ